MKTCVFDIETIPDVAQIRQQYQLNHLDDRAAVNAFNWLQSSQGRNPFAPHHFQQIVAISIVMADGENLKVWSVGDLDSDESEIIQRFFHGIDKYQPTLVSWNGNGFDLPVLHYRALKNNISAPQYWETGDHQQNYRYNNYLNRFHNRHLDLMDILAGYQLRGAAPLDEIASQNGFPGKMGMSGAKVWDTYCDGNLKAIRDYCETDVLNTYLVYLKFELMRGNLSDTQYENKINLLHQFLDNQTEQHFKEFNQKLGEN